MTKLSIKGLIVIYSILSVDSLGENSSGEKASDKIFSEQNVTNQEYLPWDTSFYMNDPIGKSSPRKFWATFYYSGTFDEVDAKKGIPLVDSKHEKLGPYLSKRDWCTGAMQGTLTVRHFNNTFTSYYYSGRLSKYTQVECDPFFKHSPTEKILFEELDSERYPFGMGGTISGQTMSVVPYRTLAADPAYAFGTVLYIPDAVGVEVTLPDGTKMVHDGFFMIADRGGKISGNHLDVFLGTTDENPFEFIKSTSSGTFKTYIVKDKEIVAKMKKLHRLF